MNTSSDIFKTVSNITTVNSINNTIKSTDINDKMDRIINDYYDLLNNINKMKHKNNFK